MANRNPQDHRPTAALGTRAAWGGEIVTLADGRLVFAADPDDGTDLWDRVNFPSAIWLMARREFERERERKRVAAQLDAIPDRVTLSRSETLAHFSTLTVDPDPAPLGGGILSLGSGISRRGPPPSNQLTRNSLDTRMA